MKVALATAAVLIAATLTSAANADNFGTTRTQAAQMKTLILKTFGNGYTGRCFLAIAARESGYNPLASNWGDGGNAGSFGLLQLNSVHRWRGESQAAFQQRMWNPVTHLAAARRLYNGAGFGPWGGCPG